MNRALRCVAWLTFLLAGWRAGYGQELSRYEESLTLAADGSAVVRVALDLRGAAGQPLLIPARHKELRGLRTKGIALERVRVVERNGAPFVMFDPPATAGAAATIELEYAVDGYVQGGGRAGAFGNRPLSYRFVNVSFAAIGAFRAAIILPEGFVFSTVGRFVPEPEKEGMVAPFTIAREGGRTVGRIVVDGVGLGGEIALSCTFRSGTRSKTILVFLAILALAYLVFFRGVLKNGRNGAAAPGAAGER